MFSLPKTLQTFTIAAKQTQNSPLKVTSTDSYERVNQVGEGTYGKVYRAVHKMSGVTVALKKVRIEVEKDGFPVTAIREIRILHSLRHQNIIKLFEIITEKENNNSPSILMVLEYMDHDLTGILSNPNLRLLPAHIKNLVHQMFLGLDHLHSKNIIHRDLKGSNLLLNSRGELKIADFGLARHIYSGCGAAIKKVQDFTNRVITLWYRPPELLLGAVNYQFEVDLWSAGCIILELFTGEAIFRGTNEMEQLDIIFKLCGTPCSSTWPDITDLPWWSMMRPRSVIKRNLKGQFNHLLSIYALELVDKLLKLDPKQRPKSSAVLKHSYFTETPVACSNDEYFQLISRLPKIDGDWHEYDSKMRKKMTQSQNRQIAPPIDERQSSTLSSNTPLTRRESTSALTIPHRTSTSDLSVNALSVKSQPIVSLVTKNPLLSYSSTRFLPPPPPLIRTEERKPRDEVMRDRPTRSYRSSSSSSSDVSPVKKRRLDSEPDLQRNDQFNRDSDKRRSDDIRKRDDSSLKSERQKSKSPIRKTRDPSPKRASINIKSKSPTRVNDHQQNYPRNQDSRSYNVRKNDSISYSSSRDGTWKHDKFPPRKSDYGNSDRHYSSSDNRKQYDRQSYDRPYDDYDRRYYDDHRRQPQIERIVERKFEKPKIDTYRPGNEVKVAPRRDAPLKNSTEIANNHAIRRASISKDTVVTERISKSRNTLDERGNDRSDSRDFKSSNRNEARDRQEPKRVESSSVMIELFFKPKTEEWDHVQPEPDNNHEERVSPKAGDSITAEEVSLMSSVVPMDIMYTLKTPSKQSSPIHDEESPFKNQGDIERRATPLARKASEIEEGEEIEEEIDETMQVELSGDVIPLGIRESEGNEGSNEGNEGNTIKSSVLWNWKG